MTVEAYPLTWPEGWLRTDDNSRQYAKFGKKVSRRSTFNDQYYRQNADITVADATNRLSTQLDRMGVYEEDIIISTNLQTRLDGLPRSGQRAPKDPGAAVYWENAEGNHLVIAIDLYFKVEHNMAAIAATLDALRGIERWGGAKILERAFTGFTALEDQSGRDWREVVDNYTGNDLTGAELLFRIKLRDAHPDRGGDPDQFHILMKARDAMRQELGK